SLHRCTTPMPPSPIRSATSYRASKPSWASSGTSGSTSSLEGIVSFQEKGSVRSGGSPMRGWYSQSRDAVAVLPEQRRKRGGAGRMGQPHGDERRPRRARQRVEAVDPLLVALAEQFVGGDLVEPAGHGVDVAGAVGGDAIAHAAGDLVA